MSQDEKEIQVDGLIHEIDENRSVFVAQQAGRSEVFIEFTNGDDKTKIKCSFEAAEALRDLLERVSKRGLMSTCTWTLATEKPKDNEEVQAGTL